ncbi:hypothetical protein [Pilimelia terevasa]|uniref:hypothetical protein n=1 Tax=Pilimelia terevasa TaxID=53372 RepID=UPI00166CA626|nr:hypothetical protein [Pilimelia terevasa]
MKGQPAVTTTALGLAAVLSAGARVLLVEADPSGGDLASNFRVPIAPGLVELASQTSTLVSGVDAAVLERFTRRLPAGGGVSAIVAPPAGSRTVAAVAVVAVGRGRVLRQPDVTVVADVGRVSPASAAWPLMEAADRMVLMMRGRLGDLAHLHGLLPELLAAVGGRLTIVLCAGGGGYRPAQVTDSVHTAVREAGLPSLCPPVWGPLPHDETTARMLAGERKPHKKWRHTPLMRALDELAADLTRQPAATGGGR